MMDKKIFALIFLGIFLINVIPLTSAYFTKSHEYWTLKGFEEVNSPITQMCEDKLDIVLDGNTGSDIFVIHYTDKKFMSYIFTHVRSAYLSCLEQAGTDEELRCLCVGTATHNIQDHFSHTDVGLVPKYLKKSFAPNLIGHMTVENDFQKKHLKLIENDPILTSGKLDYYDSIVCDNFFEQSGGDFKFVNIFNEISGIDMINTANIFCNSYKGVGFYNAVYNQKLSLPWWFYGISIGLSILGFGVAILFIIFGRTNWKYAMVFIYLMVALLGILILLSFFTNNTWQWIQYGINIVPISVSDADVAYYNDVVQQATNQFLMTGNLPFDDNSGLSYTDRGGNKIDGALGQAERPFQFIVLPVIVLLFVMINIPLMYKSFAVKRKGTLTNKIMNILLIIAGASVFVGILTILILQSL